MNTLDLFPPLVQQIPALIVVSPLFAALIIGILGIFLPRVSYPLTVLTLAFATANSVFAAILVSWQGPIFYQMGGWPAPFGIQYRIDSFSAVVLCMVMGVATITAVYSYHDVRKNFEDRVTQFYVLFLLLATGLGGMVITADLFNLYVLLEVSSLSTYALLSLGKGRAYIATLQYLIIGTIGASLYLLGVGYVLIKTGTLNMLDAQIILADMGRSPAVIGALSLMLIGTWIKMGFFPMHGWLPNAYTYAPTTSSSLIAPLVTKVSIYVMIRVMISVFSPEQVFGSEVWNLLIVWMATIAIVAGAVMALAQTEIKKMFSYLIVAEVGYMVGGAWLRNASGLTGSVFHILADGAMTLCLFLSVGAIIHVTGASKISELKGMFRKMPWTMGSFTVAGLAIIGIPPTCGFFSKWYLIKGSLEAGQYQFAVALLISSLISAVLFFRIFEIAYFEPLPPPGKHPHHHDKIREAPLSMLIPLLLTAVGLVLLGISAGSIIETFVIKFIPVGWL